jgi:RNA polymerase sigma-70 factor (ECF subfamily)
MAALHGRTARKQGKMGATKAHWQLTESELLERARQRDKDAFYKLVCSRERAVYVAAISILDNPADAEEVAQEAVLKAFANLAQFRGEAKFNTWLIQITINEARLRLRKGRRHLYESVDEHQTDEESDDYFPKDFADWREVPSETLERAELRQALKQAIAGLAPKYREVLILRDVQHMSIEETARALGISEGNVKNPPVARPAANEGRAGSWNRRQLEHG